MPKIYLYVIILNIILHIVKGIVTLYVTCTYFWLEYITIKPALVCFILAIKHGRPLAMEA